MSQDDSAERSEHQRNRACNHAIVIEQQGVSGRVSSRIRRAREGNPRCASRSTSGSNGKLLQAASSVAPCSPRREESVASVNTYKTRRVYPPNIYRSQTERQKRWIRARARAISGASRRARVHECTRLRERDRERSEKLARAMLDRAKDSSESRESFIG